MGTRTANTVYRDKEEDNSIKEKYKKNKKGMDERSKFSDEMSSLYGKYVSLIMKMLKFDRRYLNIEFLDELISKSSNKYGQFIKPKGNCLTSGTLCSEHSRKFEFKIIKKGTDNTATLPKEIKKEIRVDFDEFIDKNGNPSSRMRGLIKGIYGLKAEVVIVELSRVMQFCRIFLETMKNNIVRFYGLESSQYKFYQGCYNTTSKLNSKYKKLAKEFSTRAHTPRTNEKGEKIEYSKKVQFFSENKLDKDDEISFTHEHRLKEWEIKFRKVIAKNKEIRNIIEKGTYSRPANYTLKKLNEFSIKVGTKYKNRFEAIKKTAENKTQIETFIKEFKDNERKDMSFYAKAQVKVDDEFKKLRDRLQELKDGEEELKKYIKSKEELNKELEGKSDKKKLKLCSDYLSAIKRGIRELDIIYEKYGRAVENTNNYLIEMNNLTKTKEWKDWIKNKVKPILKGHGRMLKLKLATRKEKAKAAAQAKAQPTQQPADYIPPPSSQPPTLSTPSNEPIPRMHAPESAPNLQGNASTDTYTGKPLPRDPLSPEVSVES